MTRRPVSGVGRPSPGGAGFQERCTPRAHRNVLPRRSQLTPEVSFALTPPPCVCRLLLLHTHTCNPILECTHLLSPQQLLDLFFPLGSFFLCQDAALSALEPAPVRADVVGAPLGAHRVIATNLLLHPTPTVCLQMAIRGRSGKLGTHRSLAVAETCVFAGFTPILDLRPELQKTHSKQQVFA